MENGGVLIHNGNSSGYIKLAAPSAQASNVTLTFPGSLPTSRTLLTVDTGGNMGYATAGTGTVGFTITGSLTAAGSLIATQTGSAPVLHATRELLHDNEYTLSIPAAAMNGFSPAGMNSAGYMNTNNLSAASKAVFIPVTLKSGDRITSWTVYAGKATAGGSGLVAQMFHYDTSLGYVSVGGPTVGAAASGSQTISTGSLTHTINNAGAGSGFLMISVNGSGFSDNIFGAEVTYNRPTGSV
jgi:hypothetical protein